MDFEDSTQSGGASRFRERSTFPRVLRFVALWIVVILQAGCGGEETDRRAPGGETEGVIVTSVDGLPLSYEARGAGDTALVFVHGWSCDRTYWDGQIGSFSRNFRVVAVDLAGHGESGLGRGEWTIASYGSDVARVVEELDLRRVILIGHSMGGDVAVGAARLLLERVVGIVWVDTYGQLGSVRTAEQVEAVLAPFRVNFADSTHAFVRRNLFLPISDPALAERVARDMASAPPHIALASLESSITNDRVVPRVLEELDLPVVSLNPESSNPDVSSLESHGVEVVLVPDLGHFMMMEDPTSFNEILADVIERILDGAS